MKERGINVQNIKNKKKECQKLNIKNSSSQYTGYQIDQSILKENAHIEKKYIYIYMKQYSTCLVFREIEIKTSLRVTLS